MIRNHYVGRTFIQPSQAMRDFGVRVKLNPVQPLIEDKRIVIVEDSIIRGTTSRNRVRHLRESGAKEIHMVVSCPPTRHPCPYGIDFSVQGGAHRRREGGRGGHRLLHRPGQPALPLRRGDGRGHGHPPGKLLPRLLQRRLSPAAPEELREVLLRGADVLKQGPVITRPASLVLPLPDPARIFRTSRDPVYRSGRFRRRSSGRMSALRGSNTRRRSAVPRCPVSRIRTGTAKYSTALVRMCSTIPFIRSGVIATSLQSVSGSSRYFLSSPIRALGKRSEPLM